MAGSDGCAESGSGQLDLDELRVTVAEQLEPTSSSAVDNDTQNELGKNIDRYPGLVLRPGTHRYYPYGDVACHVLGHLAKVDREDLERRRAWIRASSANTFPTTRSAGRDRVALRADAPRHARAVSRARWATTTSASRSSRSPGQDVRLVDRHRLAAADSVGLSQTPGFVTREGNVVDGACCTARR